MLPPFDLPDGQIPADVCLSATADALRMHVGTLGGMLIEAEYTAGRWTVVTETRLFKKAVRTVTGRGRYILATSVSGRITILKDGSVHRKTKTLKNPDGDSAEISAFCLLSSEEELAAESPEFNVAVGDDLGNVYILKLAAGADTWEPLMVVEEQEDSITGIVHHAYRRSLVASSGDGTLLILDLKKLKIVAHSSTLDDEIMCVALDQASSNVLCGTGRGALVQYKWGYWGKVALRLKPSFHEGSPVSAVALQSDADQMLLTGTVGGAVRKITLKGGLAVDSAVQQLDDSVERMYSFAHAGRSQACITLANEAKVYFAELAPAVSEAADEVQPRQKKAKAVERTMDSATLGSFLQGLD